MVEHTVEHGGHAHRNLEKKIASFISTLLFQYQSHSECILYQIILHYNIIHYIIVIILYCI